MKAWGGIIISSTSSISHQEGSWFSLNSKKDMLILIPFLDNTSDKLYVVGHVLFDKTPIQILDRFTNTISLWAINGWHRIYSSARVRQLALFTTKSIFVFLPKNCIFTSKIEQVPAGFQTESGNDGNGGHNAMIHFPSWPRLFSPRDSLWSHPLLRCGSPPGI